MNKLSTHDSMPWAHKSTGVKKARALKDKPELFEKAKRKLKKFGGKVKNKVYEAKRMLALKDVYMLALSIKRLESRINRDAFNESRRFITECEKRLSSLRSKIDSMEKSANAANSVGDDAFDTM